jgi:hypothetical protein
MNKDNSKIVEEEEELDDDYIHKLKTLVRSGMIRGKVLPEYFEEHEVMTFDECYDNTGFNLKYGITFKKVLEYLSEKRPDVYHVPQIIKENNVNVLRKYDDDDDEEISGHFIQAWLYIVLGGTKDDPEGETATTKVFWKKKEALKAAYLEWLIKCNPHWEKDVPLRWKQK